MKRTLKEWINNFRIVVVPLSFNEKYKYLGVVPYNEGEVFDALLPLVLTMDYYAKPKWCPRWILRLLHLLGNDNSIVRVRFWTLHRLHQWLTDGNLLIDYKLKWNDYDLRISVSGSSQVCNLADDIEHRFYERGRRKFLLKYLSNYPHLSNKYKEWDSLSKLEEVYSEVKPAKP